MGQTKYDVFISYSRKDTEIAEHICNALNYQGISYFIDRQGISGGKDFPQVLATAIKNCRIILYLASKNSYESKYTDIEITFAFQEKPTGSILPYIIDNTNLPDTQRLILANVNTRKLKEHPIDTVLMQDLCQLLERDYKEKTIKMSMSNSIQEAEGARRKAEDEKRKAELIEAEKKRLEEKGLEDIRRKEEKERLVIKRNAEKFANKNDIKYVTFSNGYKDKEKRRLGFGIYKSPQRNQSGREPDVVVIPCKWKDAYDFKDGVALVKDENDKWGLIDRMGEFVSACKWTFAKDFSEGLAVVVNEKGEYGYIDKSGMEIIPCRLLSAESFSGGLAFVSKRTWMWWRQPQYGFINKKGDVVIYSKWRICGHFSEGLARVEDKNGKIGFINDKGCMAIDCQWKWAYDFSEGLACVENENWKSGFIDKAGKIVIPCKLDSSNSFKLSKTASAVINGMRYEIDKSGKICLVREFYRYCVEGICIGMNADKNRYGFYNPKTHETVIPPIWKYALFFSEGLAAVQNDDDKWGYIDTKGTVVIPCKWKVAWPFSKGQACVKDCNDNWLSIDKMGKVVEEISMVSC